MANVLHHYGNMWVKWIKNREPDERNNNAKNPFLCMQKNPLNGNDYGKVSLLLLTTRTHNNINAHISILYSVVSNISDYFFLFSSGCFTCLCLSYTENLHTKTQNSRQYNILHGKNIGAEKQDYLTECVRSYWMPTSHRKVRHVAFNLNAIKMYVYFNM